MTHFKYPGAEMRKRSFFLPFFWTAFARWDCGAAGLLSPPVGAHVLPFCVDTDCSIRTPKIASQENMTAAGTPGIILGHCGGEKPLGERRGEPSGAGGCGEDAGGMRGDAGGCAEARTSRVSGSEEESLGGTFKDAAGLPVLLCCESGTTREPPLKKKKKTPL